MKELAAEITSAARGARGAAVILSANPMSDTGGGQRSAQMALELLDREYAVLFVSHGKVTETVDLELRYDQPRLVEVSLDALISGATEELLGPLLAPDRVLVITQVPVREWIPVLEVARRAGAVTVYDCIDHWDSELGRGWYDRAAEEEIAREADLAVASASKLVDHLELLAERVVPLLPNAYNSRVFRGEAGVERPGDMPTGAHVALYVGALWGGWMDWPMMRRAAEARPETTFVFVGDHRREGRDLPGNCHFLGLKPQTDLPGYLAHADLAFLPWKADEVTQATSPLKVYEFVAMGLPVVAPDTEPLRGIPGVSAVPDEASFVEAVRTARRGELSAETREAMAVFAADSSWVQRVDALLGWADEVRASRAARGGRARDASGPGGPTVRSGGTLSVVIPAYNHERWVGAAVESALEQTLPAGEVLVVDDGSSDGTPGVLEAIGSPLLRVIRQENRGAHAAINRGIARASGDWIAVLNSDDVFSPERLEHAWAAARTTGAALLVGGVRLIDAEGRPLPEDHDSSRWYREAKAEPRRGGSLRRALLRHNFAVTTSNFFFHRELWRRLGGFAAYRYVHDYDFMLRALELCGDRVVYAEELDDVRYRVHGSNTILEDVPRALEERAEMLGHIRSWSRRWKAFWARGRDARAVAAAVDEAEAPAPVSRAEPDASDGRSATRGPRPTVGLVVPTLDQGGLEEVVALLARSLPAVGVDAVVLCTHGGGAVAERLGQAGVPVTVSRGRVDEWRRWRDDTEPDVLSTHFVGEDVVATLEEGGAPIFETVHNTYAWLGPDGWAAEKRKRAGLAGTIAVSELVARYYARFTETAKTPHVVPNAIQPSSAAGVPKAWARRWLGLPAEGPIFAHLGRVTLQKNVHGLLRGFARVSEAEPEARLVLAGSLDDRGYVRSVRSEHRALFASGSVLLLPPVRHVGTVLSAADGYVSDSFFEGWSLAASEAMWQGLPLVLSDCGSGSVLVDGGARGVLVPNPLGDPLDATRDRLENPPAEPMARNEAELAEAMLSVLRERDRWVERREVTRSEARAILDPRTMAEAYAEVFLGALGTAP